MMKRHAKPIQFLLRLFLVATVIFLSSASFFSRLWAATLPFGTFTYDGPSETTVAYDSGNKSAVDFTRTFTSQTVAPGVDMTIMRLIVGGH